MRRRRAGRPTDPVMIAKARAAAREKARDPASWGVDHTALDLPANALVVTDRDLAGRIARAARRDVFDLLRGRGRLGQQGYDAVRRLQSDLARLHARAGGVAGYRERVDHQRIVAGPGDAALEAGGRIRLVLARTGAVSASLLLALIEGQGPGLAWREVVARASGEVLADAQSAVVRQACENLAAAYASVCRERS